METNPLTLLIKEKTLGNLVTNIKDIKAYVLEELKKYDVSDCIDAKEAAEKRAKINGGIKILNDRRIFLEKEWNMPFQEFKNAVNETIGLMKEAAGKLDVLVKESENREKEAKKAEVMRLWEDKKFNLVEFDRIFNSKWLNKTAKLTSIDVEMDDIIKRINGDLASLDAFGEDTATLKDLYLSTLDLQKTLNKGAELKANRERIGQMEAQRKAAEEKAKETIAEPQEETNESEQNKGTSICDVNVSAKEVHKVEPGKEPSKGAVTYTFNVFGGESEIDSVRAIADDMGLEIIPSITLRGTVNQINAFKETLNDNGIGYDKHAIINLAAKRI